MRCVMMAVMIAVGALHVSLARADTGKMELESLRGLPGVEVHIGGLDERGAEVITEKAIRTEVERVLRSNGIQILTRAEAVKLVSKPYLHVGVTLVEGRQSSLYSVCLLIELVQQVSLIHRPGFDVGGTTWRMGKVLIGSESLIGSSISENIGILMESFADDFLSINPQ